MGLELIKKEVLGEWINTYTEKLQDSEKTEETRSSILSLDDVKKLVNYIDSINQDKQPKIIDGIEIYLTRWSECKDKTKINKITSKGNIDQIGFAIVPLKGKGTENFFQKNDNGEEEIMCLYPGHESDSGHCPPCSKQQEAGNKDSL